MVQTIIHKLSPLDEKYIQIEFQDLVILENSKLKIKDIGSKSAALSSYFFEYLTGYQVPTAYVKQDSDRILKFVDYTEFKFFIKILNVADKRLSKILGIKEHSELKLPVYEFRYGNYKENLLNESHLLSFEFCNAEEIRSILRISSKINAVLKSFFERRNEFLTELDLKFCKLNEKLYVCGNFTPFGIKVFTKSENNNWVDPYKLKSSNEIKKYTDFLYNIVRPN